MKGRVYLLIIARFSTDLRIALLKTKTKTKNKQTNKQTNKARNGLFVYDILRTMEINSEKHFPTLNCYPFEQLPLKQFFGCSY
jgi:hypothetical protein